MFRLASILVLSIVVAYVFRVSWYSLLPVTILTYILTGGWKQILILSKISRKDLFLCRMMVESMYRMAKAKISGTTTPKDFLYKCAKKHPDRLAIVMADTNESLTFKETERFCHKVANIFYIAGFRKGDVVALLMENRIEYMPIWIGLSMIGVVTSLVNYNLRKDSLKHCINICNCKAIIFSEQTSASLKEIESDLNIKFYYFDKGEASINSYESLPVLIESASSLPPPKSQDAMEHDTLLYLYTSGTTGLPKAVIWRTFKHFSMVPTFPAYGVKKNDILYQSLPLYHGNGMAVASIFFLNGITVILKKKFSASQFIVDCCKYNVTCINYIGEICRYILAQPKSVFDNLNRIRWAFGNGLRASIWVEFRDRFQIDSINEFYGSTEGNAIVFPNVFGRVGAVGYGSRIFPHNVKILKMNDETNEILRAPNGLAIEAKPGEPGQAVGIISKLHRFDGYKNQDETKKKITHDIVSKGDSAFLTGDILIKDDEGYFYFRDRIGDTFRWKGENVSTNEVEGLLSKIIESTDVCVYGVEVPGTEGKAGMACICDPDRKIDVDGFPRTFNEYLPKYARPVFLRMTSSIDVTSTFKYQKKKLQIEGFAPQESADSDSIYYYSNEENKYLLIDSDVYQQIMSECIRF